MILRFHKPVVAETADCWAEFSVDAEFSKELNAVRDELRAEHQNGVFRAPAQHHVTLLYGYHPNNSSTLMDIVKRHIQSPQLMANMIRILRLPCQIKPH